MAWPKHTWWTSTNARDRGRIGGKASGITRGKNRQSPDYKRGYQGRNCDARQIVVLFAHGGDLDG